MALLDSHSSCSAACAVGPYPSRGDGALSHHEPRPPRRRRDIWRASSSSHRLLALFLLVLVLLGECASAAGTRGDRRRHAREIVYDRSAPSDEPRMPLAPRGEAASASPTSTVLTVTSDPSVATTTALPHAFDTSLGNNFTAASCPTFFNSFLENSTFQACVPLSLLLQTSSAFFQATKSLLRITQVLDASCSADLPQCTALMDHYVTELVKDANCGADYRARNPIVMQAYDGFVAYVPSYQAGCLRDSSGSYCFANAITNSSSPTNSYPYYLPLGVPLPGGSRPTCNTCLQDTMNAYWTHASNSTQPISQTYTESASQIAMQCGPDFINRTVAASSNGVAATLTHPGALSSAALLMTLFAFVF